MKHQGKEVERFEKFETRDLNELVAYINMDDTIKGVQFFKTGTKYGVLIEHFIGGNVVTLKKDK